MRRKKKNFLATEIYAITHSFPSFPFFPSFSRILSFCIKNRKSFRRLFCSLLVQNIEIIRINLSLFVVIYSRIGPIDMLGTPMYFCFTEICQKNWLLSFYITVGVYEFTSKAENFRYFNIFVGYFLSYIVLLLWKYSNLSQVLFSLRIQRENFSHSPFYLCLFSVDPNFYCYCSYFKLNRGGLRLEEFGNFWEYVECICSTSLLIFHTSLFYKWLLVVVNSHQFIIIPFIGHFIH